MQHKQYVCTDGFTLTEILVAVIIVTILVTMAVPMYEKLIERSHLSEARSILASLQEAKLFAMDKMDIDVYGIDADENPITLDNDLFPKMQHLNVSFAQNSTGKSFNTKYFSYSLHPTGANAHPNAVCAVRRGGDTAGTVFYFYHPIDEAPTAAFPDDGLVCKGTYCESVYGLDNSTSAEITCNLNAQ